MEKTFSTRARILRDSLRKLLLLPSQIDTEGSTLSTHASAPSKQRWSPSVGPLSAPIYNSHWRVCEQQQQQQPMESPRDDEDAKTAAADRPRTFQSAAAVSGKLKLRRALREQPSLRLGMARANTFSKLDINDLLAHQAYTSDSPVDPAWGEVLLHKFGQKYVHNYRLRWESQDFEITILAGSQRAKRNSIAQARPVTVPELGLLTSPRHTLQRKAAEPLQVASYDLLYDSDEHDGVIDLCMSLRSHDNAKSQTSTADADTPKLSLDSRALRADGSDTTRMMRSGMSVDLKVANSLHGLKWRSIRWGSRGIESTSGPSTYFEQEASDFIAAGAQSAADDAAAEHSTDRTAAADGLPASTRRRSSTVRRASAGASLVEELALEIGLHSAKEAHRGSDS